MSPADRERIAGLIEANHTFPGLFYFSVVALNRDDVRDAVRAAFAFHFDLPIADQDFTGTASANGRYMSHRVTVLCQSAEQVVAMYERLSTINGVVAVL